ncbi:glycosyltransferase [Roseicella aerolata]|uniref:Glycosyltransferase n=1 Tax=Roseicella aerolata TaxID=2883479 RepID=A0A9X1I8H6_9PROT|nr:glycosyltransferase [Roseicella aerolata]MCB4820191.1 glycosyltransferase [Roseicella aerolata]
MTDALPGSVAHASALSQPARRSLLLCLSHLRWNFVFQRPQHLLTRAARDHDVIFFEEPLFQPGIVPRLDLHRVPEGVTVAVPLLPEGLQGPAIAAAQRSLLDGLLEAEAGREMIAWFYTPMALEFAAHLRPDLTVYDCMDELSAFRGAPPRMLDLERALLGRADLVFTGGRSLYEAKRGRHPRVHCFPSSIDAAHFAAARVTQPDAADQAALPRPRIGFFGVVDERMDLGLVAALAAARPDWTFAMIGPVVKIDPEGLPRLPNIHWLGGKRYAELPHYLAGWDAGFMPFARNESTRFISPTKTPEFLAAGLPVVSTPITDVLRDWGPKEAGGPGLVEIAADPVAFAAALQAVLARPRGPWLKQVDRRLAQLSWDRTWAEMKGLIAARRTVTRLPAREEASAARIA